MASSPADILSSPARSVTVGSRPVHQRRSWGVFQKAAAAVLLSATALVAQAHEHPGHAGAAQAETVSPSQAVLTQAARTSSNSLLDKASQGAVAWMSTTGQVDANAMLEQWRQGGVSVEQAFELINVLALTQSPVIGRTQGSLDKAAELSASTRAIADIQNARNAEFFLRRHGLEALVDTNRISAVEAFNVQTGEDQTWEQALDYWNTLARQRHGEVPLVGAAASASDVATAQQALTKAVDHVGLASLRVPLAAWGNPAAMTAMADRLVEANATLEQLTGWSGQVLGLNGRISITPFAPADNAFAYRATDGTLRLDTHWEDVPHEWVHVLDSVLRTAPVAQVLGGGSLSHQVFTDGHTDAIGQAWKSASASWSTSETVGDWMARRQIMLNGLAEGSSEDKAKALYFGSANEMMGYAWGAYVQSQVPKDSVFHDARQAERMAYDGEHGPTVAQASGMKKDWQALFQTVGQQWWAQQAAPAAQMPSLAQWRQARQSEQPLELQPTRLAMGF